MAYIGFYMITLYEIQSELSITYILWSRVKCTSF